MEASPLDVEGVTFLKSKKGKKFFLTILVVILVAVGFYFNWKATKKDSGKAALTKTESVVKRESDNLATWPITHTATQTEPVSSLEAVEEKENSSVVDESGEEDIDEDLNGDKEDGEEDLDDE